MTDAFTTSIEMVSNPISPENQTTSAPSSFQNIVMLSRASSKLKRATSNLKRASGSAKKVGNKVKGKSKEIFAKMAKAEMGVITGTPKLVAAYLANKTKFEMEVDERWEDYNYSFTNSVPPLYSKKTANICSALPIYPLCCLPCCCCKQKKTCPNLYEKYRGRKDRKGKVIGGFGCMGW